MTTRRLLPASVIALCLLSLAAPARAETIPLEGGGPFPLRPGDILRAEFDVRWLGPDVYEPSNVLLFAPGVTAVEPIGSYTTRLYDRGRLLGTYTRTRAEADDAVFRSWFKAPGTIFTFENPTIVDFSSFQDGTFDGAVEFEIGSGLARIFRTSDELDLDRALSPGVASGAGFAPRTLEMDVPDAAPVPEPGSLLLIGSGLAGLVLRQRRYRRIFSLSR